MKVAVILGTLFATSACAQNWTSQLFPQTNGQFSTQTVNFAGRDWTLDDFSYVGYQLGQVNLGSVTCNKTVAITGTGDITRELQRAIDTVGTGGGGAVLIPAGSFLVSGAVAIPYDNVSIEGAGSANTVIQVTSNYNSQETPSLAEAVFTFGRKLNTINRGWVDQGRVVATAAAVVHRGDLFVDTISASNVNSGDWVVVQQYFWPDLVSRNSDDEWPANSTTDHSIYSFSYLRQVTGKDGNRVLLDAPIPWTLDPANNPVRIRLTDGKMHENSGIKGLSIRFENNTDPRTGRPHGAAVYFEGVRNGWAYDIQVSNFPRYGLYALYSARITFLDCRAEGAQDTGGNGYGYGFLTYGAQNILFRRCSGENNRHNFISSRSLTSMIVYTRCVSSNATQPDDTHFGLEQALLWDKHTQLNGESLTEFNRGEESGGGHETLLSGVVWNFFGDGIKGRVSVGGGVYLKPSADGDAIVVGVNGNHQVFDNSLGNTASPFVRGDRMTAFAGLQVGPGANALGNVLYEGLYQPGLTPESLYDAQLQNRAGVAPAEWGGGCGTGVATTPASEASPER
jgi:Pectate lyase superfamily protein